MKLTVKAKFNASKESFEKFSEGMYLIYLPFEEDEESWKIIAELISKKIGTTVGRIEFAAKDIRGNYVYEVV